MSSYSKVILMGHVARDPETRFTPKGVAIATVTLGTNRKWRDGGDGEEREEACFVDCVAFGKTAEVASKYVRKGNPLMIEGRLRQEQWEDKQSGQKRSKLSVVIENLVLMGTPEGSKAPDASRQPGAQQENIRGRAAPNAGKAPATKPGPCEDDAAPPEDDVPF